MKVEDRFRMLVHRTFHTEAGQDLMKELHAMYVAQSFNENPYVMSRNCGQSDLVLFLQSVLDEE